MSKLVLIVDKSQAYLHFERDRTLDTWGVDKKDIRFTKTLVGSGAASLFGDVPTSVIHIDAAETAKRIITEMQERTKEDLTEAFSSGLLVTCELDRRQTKKLESVFKEYGGEVLCPPAGRNDEPVAVKLVRQLKLNPQVEEYLLGYVGQQYDAVIPFLETLSKIPAEHRKKITEEDIYYRIAQAPGSVPPWEIETPVMAGNVNEAINIARRVEANSSYLLWLSVLKNKITNAFRAAVLIEDNPRITDEKLAESLGVPTRGLYFTRKTVKQHGREKLERAAVAIIVAEAKIKGGSAAPGSPMSEQLIVELCAIMRGN